MNICIFVLQAVTAASDRDSQDAEKRLQQYSKENKDRLNTIYDKYYWEMKPAAKVTGAKQPNMKTCKNNYFLLI